MKAKLVITVEKNYPSDMDLTSYEGCDTVLEAAKLDKQLIDQGLFSIEDFLDSENTRIDIRVLGEVVD